VAVDLDLICTSTTVVTDVSATVSCAWRSPTSHPRAMIAELSPPPLLSDGLVIRFELRPLALPFPGHPTVPAHPL